MRLSRVPVTSLYRRDLAYDPGGFHTARHDAARILRSSTMKLSAFALDRNRRPLLGLSFRTTTFKQLSRLNTDPADLLSSASDLCLLRPTSSATGLVANLCPREDLHLLDDNN